MAVDQTVDSVVYIKVNRNLNAPSFTLSHYEQTIVDTTDPGTLIETVEAKDDDNVSIEFLFYLLSINCTNFEFVTCVNKASD